MFHRFDQLSLRARIAIGFAALIAFTLVAGGVSLASHRRALAAVETFLDRDHRIAELGMRSNAEMLKARRNEKDFLLRIKEFGYEETRSRYATLVRAHLATVRENMAAIRALTDDPGVVEETHAIERIADRYETGFLEVVGLYGRLGRRDAGLEGQFRIRAHAIEALLAEGAPESLMTGLLALRRAEKDYLLRGSVIYVETFDRTMGRYREKIGSAALPQRRKAELLRLTAEYRELFRQYAAVDAAIGTASLEYLGAVHTMEPRLEHLHAHASEAAAATRATLHRLNRTTMWTVAGASLGALLLGLAVAFFISRNVNRMVREFMDFAGSMAAGNLAVRLPASGRNEFGALVVALNRMADALQDAYRLQQEQQDELRRLNRVMRLLSQCNETLVRTRSEPELLQVICRHMVEIGGYRQAWVGYAQRDEGSTVLVAACVGEGADYLEHLAMSWADSADGDHLAGTAIREGKTVAACGIPSFAGHAAWREAALQHGFASAIALPLICNDERMGALTIHAAEPDAFNPAEVKVLQELADDLAYGIASLRETEERKRFERELERQANSDALTGLANRFAMEARLQQSLAEARRRKNKVAMMFIDLDRFKNINDTLGHAVGDRMLVEMARRLASAVRESDTVARLGGDEFVICLKDMETSAFAADVAGKVIARMALPLSLDHHEIRPSVSIGISVFPEDGDDVDAIMKNADIAMYHAKSLGGGNFRFYAPEMNARLAGRFAMEEDLRLALERGELLVYFQPQVSLVSGVMTGAEALVRWRHPVKGMVPPSEFIPLAEETGLIQRLGEWVMDSVCRQLRSWLDAGLPVPTVAVNLSARQFRQEGLASSIRQLLDRHGVEAKYLELEITESAVMYDMETAIATLCKLKALGLRLSLDDFGTGYSSLSYLKRFPIDHLKIDQSFVRDIITDPNDAAICIAVIGLAHNLKLTVIAEGVESEGQMHYLRCQHCDEMQGYYFSRPLPADEFAQLLATERTLVLPSTDEAQRTLLIVDDDAHILSALKRMLHRDGYNILTAASAREGLEILAIHPVQVILSDQRIPEMSGTEFLGKVKELYPDTIRIILSGFADVESVIGAINHGAIYQFFTKPWDDNVLRASIQEAFRHWQARKGAAE